MKSWGTLGLVSFILVLIGGVNWGLVGLGNINLVGLIFGSSFLARLIYILVGLSAVYLIYLVYVKKQQ
jgi:hypothetical protein